MNVCHVYPVDDLIEHERQGDECICGPDVYYVEGTKIVTHHSLDGRELAEPMKDSADGN